MLKQVEGSRAVAEVVALCRPNVISAYPITPQTHIVEDLASIVGRGELDAEYVNVESEFFRSIGCIRCKCRRRPGLFGVVVPGIVAHE